jgi:prepilin-type N-terminal cleavage/methylation domain-containing protein
MRKLQGYTFIELVIVIGIIAIASSFAMLSSKDTTKTYTLLGDAEKAAGNMAFAIAKAQSSQSSVNIVCSGRGVFARFFKGKKSNALYGTVGTVSLGVTNATSSGNPDSIFTIIDYGAYTNQNKSLGVSCTTATGNGTDAYITSDGALINTYDSFKMTFSSTQNPDLISIVTFSAVGYPRIYLQDSSISSIPHEIIN